MPVKASSATLAAAGAILSLLAALPAAEAAPQSADRTPAKLADAAQVRPAAVTETDEDPASCSKSRKRLWIEGEGWVVRKVTTCR